MEKRYQFRGLPCGLVVKIPPSQCWGLSFNPCWRNQDPTCLRAPKLVCHNLLSPCITVREPHVATRKSPRTKAKIPQKSDATQLNKQKSTELSTQHHCSIQVPFSETDNLMSPGKSEHLNHGHLRISLVSPWLFFSGFTLPPFLHDSFFLFQLKSPLGPSSNTDFVTVWISELLPLNPQ